ncbi:MAG: hypothetical protein RI885_1357 [Actinomycetota bacterium]
MSGAVLVTGASGTVGSAVVESLLAAGEQVVRGRGPRSAAAERVRDDSGGVEVDFTAPGTWAAALDGVDRVFLLRPPAIADMDATLLPFCDAALEAGVGHIVFLSLQGVTANRRTPHHAVEAHLRGRGAPFTFLRPNFFMQNLSTTFVADIRDRDEIFVPAGRAKTAMIDARDLGPVAAEVLTGTGHLGKAYTLSGARSLDYGECARILSEVLGRGIRYRAPTSSQYLERLRSEGAADDYVAVQKQIWRVVRWRLSSKPNDEVERLTGVPARGFETFASDLMDVWMPR